MTRLLILLGVLALLGGLLLVDTADAQAAQSVRVAGVITDIDQRAGTLTLKTRRGDVPVLFSSRTQVTINGRPASAADLQVRMKARVAGKLSRQGVLARLIQARS